MGFFICAALSAPSDGDEGRLLRILEKNVLKWGVGVEERKLQCVRMVEHANVPLSFRCRIKVWLFSTSFPLPLSSHPSLVSRGL